MKISKTGNRWALVNKNTNVVRRTFVSRARARDNKRSTERIFDTVNAAFVR